ncbi:MAG: thioredoxin family protein [Bacteroides sp.]|nr:thioredoxin family protein [Bacteroides sp.]
MKTFKEVISGTVPSLVVFIHAGQQNAVDIKYDMEELRKKYGDRINILRVDSSYDQRVAREYNLSHFPTYVLIKEGQELMRESGSKTVGELSEMIERAF